LLPSEAIGAPICSTKLQNNGVLSVLDDIRRGNVTERLSRLRDPISSAPTVH